jgi:peptidoglycan/xylan/chitin deacetylase (PgdA/CDA1 family)
MQQLLDAIHPRQLRAALFEWSGANGRARRRLDGSRAAILMYHRVLPAADAARLAVEPGMFVTPTTFARHLDWLTEGFRVLPLHEIVSRLAGGLPLPVGACAVTFDDGWRDNALHALPELSRREMPATVFVVTQRVGTQGAFWPDELCRRLGALPSADRSRLARELGASPGDPIEALLSLLKTLPEGPRDALLERVRAGTPGPAVEERELLDWEELARMATTGIDVESHGASHAILTGVPGAQAVKELRASRETLQARGHGRHDLLAYPSGAHDAGVRELARKAGYRAAVTTDRGLAEGSVDPLALPRLALHEDVSRSRAQFRYRVPGPP